MKAIIPAILMAATAAGGAYAKQASSAEGAAAPAEQFMSLHDAILSNTSALAAVLSEVKDTATAESAAARLKPLLAQRTALQQAEGNMSFGSLAVVDRVMDYYDERSREEDKAMEALYRAYAAAAPHAKSSGKLAAALAKIADIAPPPAAMEKSEPITNPVPYEQYVALLEKQRTAFQQMAAVLRGVKSAADADAAAPVLQQWFDARQARDRELEALGEPSPKVMEKLLLYYDSNHAADDAAAATLGKMLRPHLAAKAPSASSEALRAVVARIAAQYATALGLATPTRTAPSASEREQAP
ncbi:MAG: hypothetical protein MR894_02450 [Akkermansia muciniphila]|nr:hypothetical protein [Akkermansia muciniphila]